MSRKTPKAKRPAIRLTLILEGDDEASVVSAAASALKEFVDHKPAPAAPVTATWRWSASFRKR